MGKCFYTEEHIEYLRQNIKGRNHREVIDMFNKHFNLNKSYDTVSQLMSSNKILNGFKGGAIPGKPHFNKGNENLKGKTPSHTCYKKGDIPSNYKPVGSETFTKDGRHILIKVADPNEWRLKHIHVWEAANGAVPDGHYIIFGDGERSNCDLDNLLLVSIRQHHMLEAKGLRCNTIEATKTGIVIADTYIRINELKRGRKRTIIKENRYGRISNDRY